MNKEDKEMEYQAGIDKLYNQTQEFGRIDFVKVLFDTKKELDIANKKLERVSKLKPEELAIMFHNTYEKLAPDFGYETRKDTKTFNKNSTNGKLMIEVCKEILLIIGGE